MREIAKIFTVAFAITLGLWQICTQIGPAERTVMAYGAAIYADWPTSACWDAVPYAVNMTTTEYFEAHYDNALMLCEVRP
jgi:hypothetical protein